MPDFGDRRDPPKHELHPLERVAASLARGERLARFFPELSERLDRALQATGTDITYRDETARHYLCAEALTEILEERARSGRGRQGDEEGEIIADYSRRTAMKVTAYEQRDARERAKIEEVYSEVDVTLVRRGIEESLLDELDVSAALEEETDYKHLLSRLKPPGV